MTLAAMTAASYPLLLLSLRDEVCRSEDVARWQGGRRNWARTNVRPSQPTGPCNQPTDRMSKSGRSIKDSATAG